MNTNANSYVIPYKRPDDYRIIEVVNDIRSIAEYRDWSVRHTGLDKLSYKGKGQRVAVLDSVPSWTPVLCRNKHTEQVYIKSIAELFTETPCTAIVTDKGEEVKLVSDWQVWNGHDSHDGYWRDIIHVLRHQYTGKLRRIGARCGVVDVTPNHSLLSPHKGKLLNAAGLNCGDCVSLAPLNLLGFRRGQYFRGDEDAAWLLGFFAAEGSLPYAYDTGWLHTHGYLVTLAQKSRSVLDRALLILNNSFNVHGRVDTDGEMYKLCVVNYGLWLFLKTEALCDGEKRVPACILNAPENIRLAYLRGYNIGDGWTTSSVARDRFDYEFVNFTTKSQLLAAGLVYLIETTLQQKWHVYLHDDKPNTIQLSLNKPNSCVECVAANEIIKIIDIEYTGMVYDLETVNHTFGCGVGFVRVHNTGCDINHQDLEGQVEAVNFIAGNKQQNPWQDNCGHGCIQPDARIITSFCGLETIKTFYDNVPSTAVLTAEGFQSKDTSALNIQTLGWQAGFKPAKVLAVHRLNYTGDVYRVKFMHGELLLTPWHPVYAQTSSRGSSRTIQRVRADELKPAHRLIFNDTLQAPATAYRQLMYKGAYNTHGVAVNAAVSINLDEELAWLLGFILTDGHIHHVAVGARGSCAIALSQCTARLDLLQEAERILQTRFGALSHIAKRGNAFELKVNGRGISEFFIELGIPAGCKSKCVQVPQLITKSPVSVIMAFLGGCIDGDGSVTSAADSKPGYIRIVSASHKFASTLALLLRSIGVWANAVFVKGSSASTFGACDMWHVDIPHYPQMLVLYVKHAVKSQRLRFDTECRSRHSYPILSIQKSHYSGELYDLTVEDTHNYLAEGVVVSNTFCTGEIVAKDNGVGVIGVAPQATAFHGRILYGDARDQWRTGMDDDIAQAVYAAIKEGCGVISMSIGGPGATPVLRDALKAAEAAGLISVAAAGNERLEGSPYASYPACYDSVISVAAANKSDMPAWFSTMGVDGVAGKPEIAIASLEYYWGCLPGRTSYGKMVGTSQATPVIAGAALLWREARQKLADEGKRPFPKGADVLAEFRAWLRRVAKDTNKNGWDSELGYGVLLLSPTDDIV